MSCKIQHKRRFINVTFSRMIVLKKIFKIGWILGSTKDVVNAGYGTGVGGLYICLVTIGILDSCVRIKVVGIPRLVG